jgi:ketosteroid isomerase-like protein
MTKWLLVVLSGFTLASAQSDPNASKQVLAASDAWRQAMMKKDVAALEKYMHPDLTYVHSDGRTQSKAEVIQSYTGKEVIEAIDFSETTVRVYGTTALIKARVAQRTSQDGRSHTAHINVLHVWLKGPTGWQLVARHSSPLSPPTTP